MATDWGFLHMEPCNPCNIYTFHLLERFCLSVKVIRVWARIIFSDFPPTVLRRIQIYLAACLNAHSQAQAVEKLLCLQNKHSRQHGLMFAVDPTFKHVHGSTLSVRDTQVFRSNIKGDLLCFLNVFYFPLVYFICSCAYKRSWKLKGQSQHQQTLLSPTENTAPETPHQQSCLNFAYLWHHTTSPCHKFT